MPAGQPTLYKEEYCEIIEQLGELGKHNYQFASYLNVSVDTIYEWAKVHPKFSDSLTRAKHYSAGWWQDQAQENLNNKDFQSKVYEFNMRAKHGLGDKDRRNKLEGFKEAQNFSQQAAIIIGAATDGRLTAEEGKKLIEMISISAKIEEVDVLTKKLEELEGKAGLS